MIFVKSGNNHLMVRNIAISAVLLFFSSVSLFGCKKSLEDEKLFNEEKAIQSYIDTKKWEYSESNGVYHAIRNNTYGYQVAIGDTVTFWYKAYNLSGLVFSTNIKAEAEAAKLNADILSFDPIVWVAGSNTLIEGLERGLLMAREEQDGVILFPSAYGFGDNSVGPLQPWSSLVYDVNIVSTKNPSIAKEKEVVANFLSSNEGYIEQSVGFYMKNIVLGEGIIPTSVDTIKGTYNIFNLDGTEIASSSKDTLVLSNKRLPVVVRLAFPLIKAGSEVLILAPSPFAYGVTGTNLVDPYEPVLFNLKLNKKITKLVE